MSFPIGTRVSFKGMSKTETGVIVKQHNDFYLPLKGCAEVKVNPQGWEWLVPNSILRLRYDKPAPFTLWQLNVLSGSEPNECWYEEGGPVDPTYTFFQDGAPFIGPHQIENYWKSFFRERKYDDEYTEDLDFS